MSTTNLKRRHLTKGQQAMALAMIYPEAPRGRGKKDPARKETESVSFTRVKEARQVLRLDPELAESVFAAILVTACYQIACQARLPSASYPGNRVTRCHSIFGPCRVMQAPREGEWNLLALRP